jgi:hypothetical protein
MNCSDKTSRVYTHRSDDSHRLFYRNRGMANKSTFGTRSVLLVGEVRIDNRVEAFVLPFHAKPNDLFLYMIDASLLNSIFYVRHIQDTTKGFELPHLYNTLPPIAIPLNLLRRTGGRLNIPCKP